MLLTTHIKTKASAGVHKHYKALGYKWVGENADILVLVDHLLPKSNVYVHCKCDECGDIYRTRYRRTLKPTHRCLSCHQRIQMANGRETMKLLPPTEKQLAVRQNFGKSGSDNPRWNPNKTEYIKFVNRVHHLTSKTYNEHKTEINPNDHRRTLCGEPNGYQLDHITSIKDAFGAGWTPEQCAEKTNLQMLPWQENRAKW